MGKADQSEFVPIIARISLLIDPRSVDVLVIGAGPTGLGAAKRLNQIVWRSLNDDTSTPLTASTGRPVMDDHRLQ